VPFRSCRCAERTTSSIRGLRLQSPPPNARRQQPAGREDPPFDANLVPCNPPDTTRPQLDRDGERQRAVTCKPRWSGCVRTRRRGVHASPSPPKSRLGDAQTHAQRVSRGGQRCCLRRLVSRLTAPPQTAQQAEPGYSSTACDYARRPGAACRAAPAHGLLRSQAPSAGRSRVARRRPGTAVS